ncbi:tubby C-terminal-like domain-containing protein [Aspergillus germanicus]
MAELTDLKQPIAIRTEYIAPHPTTIHIKQKKTPKNGASGEDLTVWTSSSSSNQEKDGQKLFSVTSESVPFSQRRHLRDASGLPFFELSQKKSGVTWFVRPPGGNETVSSESIAVIAPRWNPFKNKLDVYVMNAAGGGNEVKLKVRGQDLSRLRTHVYSNGALVMAATRTSVHESVDENEWKVDVARGIDISLASVIMVVMAYMLHITAASSYRGRGDVR